MPLSPAWTHVVRPEPSPRDDDRAVSLGDRTLCLVGRAPRVGNRLGARFRLPAVRGEGLLDGRRLSCGLHVVSTLPNVRKKACSQQIAGLEHYLRKSLPQVELSHVTADDDDAWQDVDALHPELTAHGYSLLRASPDDRDRFRRAFGVGVRGERRIAHGLFALVEGAFVLVEIPTDQLAPPPVKAFVQRFARFVATRSLVARPA